MVNVNPFITDIFPEQLPTDQIANQRHRSKIALKQYALGHYPFGTLEELKITVSF
jgi:hypothetical protein